MTKGTDMPLPTDVQRLFRAPNFATMSTLGPDGSRQTSVMWVKVEGDEILFSTLKSRQKAANLTRDPRVSVLVQDPDRPYEYVEVRGTATLAEDIGRTVANNLSLAYAGQPFRPEPPDQVRLVVRVTPRKILKYLGSGQAVRLD
jgi:PPOX class probable F420-dependent enzyme